MNTRITLALSVSAIFMVVGCAKTTEERISENYRDSNDLSIPKAKAVGASVSCVVYELLLDDGKKTIYILENPTGRTVCRAIAVK